MRHPYFDGSQFRAAEPEVYPEDSDLYKQGLLDGMRAALEMGGTPAGIQGMRALLRMDPRSQREQAEEAGCSAPAISQHMRRISERLNLPMPCPGKSVPHKRKEVSD